MNKQQKNILLMVGISILILAIVGYYFYRQGKKGITIQYNPGELPGDPGSGTQYGASNDEIKNISFGLYTDMKGFNLLGHNYEPYEKALLLNDSDLIKLYNAFNTSYQKESGQTLKQWIESEQYASPNSPGLLIARFNKLNLI